MAGSLLRCDLCGYTFARQEHLTRHMRTHSREKPFECATCGKCFSRQDVLTRHHTSHQQHQDATANPTGSNRACRGCALGRVRCSKGYPCKRCAQRGLECVYTNRKNRKAFSPGAGPGAFQTSPSSAADTDEEVGQAQRSRAVLTDGGQDMLPLAINSDMDSIRMEDTIANSSISAMNDNFLWTGRVNPLANDALPNNPEPNPLKISHLYNFAPGNSFGEQTIGTFSLNWMPSEYQNDLDWDHTLGTLSYGNANLGGASDLQLPQLSTTEPVRDPRETVLDHTPSVVLDASPTGDDAHSGPLSAPGNSERRDSVSVQSAIGSTCSRRTRGRFYVDGDAARAPFKGLSLERGSVISLGTMSHATTCTTDPGSDATPSANVDDMSRADKEIASDEAYRNFVLRLQLWEDTQKQHRSAEPAVASRIPSHQDVGMLSLIYFDRFHPVYPFLHKHVSVFEGETGWILLLAVITVGAKYAQDSPSNQRHTDTLFSLLQAVLSDHLRASPQEVGDAAWALESPENEGTNYLNLAIIQAGILNQLCMLHSGNSTLLRRASLERFYLVDACNNMRLLSAADDSTSSICDKAMFKNWLERQSRVRTGMMIWMLDCISEFQFGFKSLMALNDLAVPLPCLEDVWEGATSDKTVISRSCTLLQALEMMYMEKRLPPNLSEFSTTLLILAIYRKNKEVVREQQTELSAWVPNAEVQPRTPRFNQAVGETWPPSSPLLSKWRNSACDSLDILHWSANSKVARAGGWEHPTILQLHLARLVILAPTGHMQDLAALSLKKATASQAVSATMTAMYVRARSHLLQWAIRDQFKARLAVIHAGALFWYARRYSSNSFVEPFAIYISTLVIWAYSASTQLVGRQNNEAQGLPQPSSDPFGTSPTDTGDSQECESDPEPSFIHLDRPCDDEMVQTYVRLGQKTSGHMSRVGNICAPGAPAKILQEGIRLLLGEPIQRKQGTGGGQGRPAPPLQELGKETSYTWGIEPSFAKFLRCLIHETISAS